MQGRKANNCLLFLVMPAPEKSSIKGILNEYYDQGLRIIEVYKHQFQDLNDVIAQVKNRNYRFIIYMDDLSLRNLKIEYKYLKAVIEGGLERKPENVLIYATSNRRHLIRENSVTRKSEETICILLIRCRRNCHWHIVFGLKIYFGSPSKKRISEYRPRPGRQTRNYDVGRRAVFKGKSVGTAGMADFPDVLHSSLLIICFWTGEKGREYETFAAIDIGSYEVK